MREVCGALAVAEGDVVAVCLISGSVGFDVLGDEAGFGVFGEVVDVVVVESP